MPGLSELAVVIVHALAGPGGGFAFLGPEYLDLDLFEGTAYVGVVPFAMQGVRPTWGITEVFAFNFLETNVRTYVCHQGKPGVYFFSLEAASRGAVWAARKFRGLPLLPCRDEFHSIWG